MRKPKKSTKRRTVSVTTRKQIDAAVARAEKKWSVAAAKKRNPKAFKRHPHEIATPIVDVTLNAREVAVLTRIAVSTVPVTNRDLAGVFAFEVKTYKQANSWARNCIRKIIREKLAKRIDEGSYAVTHRGTTFLNAMKHVIATATASKFGTTRTTRRAS